MPSLTDKGVYYSHRVIMIDKNQRGRVVVKTKGDANPIPDDSKFEITSKKLPVSLLVIPLSKVSDFAPDGRTLALLLILPIGYRFYLVRKFKRRSEANVQAFQATQTD